MLLRPWNTADDSLGQVSLLAGWTSGVASIHKSTGPSTYWSRRTIAYDCGFPSLFFLLLFSLVLRASSLSLPISLIALVVQREEERSRTRTRSMQKTPNVTLMELMPKVCLIFASSPSDQCLSYHCSGQPISVNFDFSYRRTTAPELLARVEGGK